MQQPTAREEYYLLAPVRQPVSKKRRRGGRRRWLDAWCLVATTSSFIMFFLSLGHEGWLYWSHLWCLFLLITKLKECSHFTYTVLFKHCLSDYGKRRKASRFLASLAWRYNYARNKQWVADAVHVPVLPCWMLGSSLQLWMKRLLFPLIRLSRLASDT